MLGLMAKVVTLFAVAAAAGGCTYFFGQQGPPADFWQPVLSPDGQYLAYIGRGKNSYEICLLDLESREERFLTNNDRDELYPSWSPDGKKIAYMSMQEKDNWDIFTIDVETGQIFRITTDPAQDANPSWAPTGEIIFNSDRGGKWAAYAVRPDGTGLRKLSFDRPEEKG